MHEPLPAGAWVSIGIAFCGLIVVPVGVHVIKQFLRALQKAKAAELAAALAPYMTKIEHDDRANRLETQATRWQEEQRAIGSRWQDEQRDMLSTIRTEAFQRETLIVDRLERLASRVDHAFASGRSPRNSGQNR